MPHRQVLTLTSGSRSVQEARRWAVRTCQAIERSDLVECAELGVSELVTNALLHGEPPIRLQLRGTTEHPRIEVSDASVVAPQPGSRGGGIDLDAFDLDAFDSGAPNDIDITSLGGFGRGLDIVSRASVAWGAVIEEDGKTVWFEPAAEFSDAAGAEFQLMAPPDTGEPRTRMGEVAIQVKSVPVHAFSRFQRHYRDLRREIRLLALAHEDDYPLAKVLSEHFNALERPLRTNMGREQVDDALEAGRESIDLRLRMPPHDARQIGELIDLLDAADDFSRAERLLTAPRSPEQRAFQIWFLSEFRRQAAGAAPQAWSGSPTPSPST
ncbi:ATP-binding protein [Nocardioides bizhenqiangii]|uniref:ATP-binding protein n=1 Tax=Nocardioides bizhenqiangii TaxID=3095076 RepID=A0ABZ0ZNZ5_9ACTN|nr:MULTISPECIES: ATP-binding protein [unclassified Nocardioides]MDZ5619963.1 ATP-binding protein [Nocardioides sp. HM23]WQQ26034.1 ATP-binding protein [Nocardioides sp. HM61]